MALLHEKSYRRFFAIVVSATLTVCGIILAYRASLRTSDHVVSLVDQAAQAEQQRQERLRAREVNANLRSPSSGTTAEQVNAVRIGMTGDEVQELLSHPYALGIELPPYSNRFGDHLWAVHDIAVKDVGFIQMVFIDRQLVGIGSLDPTDGRMCGGCLENMLDGERDWLDGLPYQVDGKCPVCESTKLLPFGVTLDQLRKQLNR